MAIILHYFTELSSYVFVCVCQSNWSCTHIICNSSVCFLAVFTDITFFGGIRRYNAPCGAGGTPLPPLSIFSLSFIGFTYFLLLSIPSLSTRIVPLHFQAGGRSRRPNLGLIFFVFYLCYLYFLVKIHCGVLLQRVRMARHAERCTS